MYSTISTSTYYTQPTGPVRAGLYFLHSNSPREKEYVKQIFFQCTHNIYNTFRQVIDSLKP